MPKFGKWILTLGLVAATPGIVAAENPFAKYLGKRNASSAATRRDSYNQQMALKIAKALRAARLNRYEMDVEFANGVCRLKGKVGTKRQREEATRICMSVDGVRRVDNRLSVLESSSPIRRASFLQSGRKKSDVRRAAYTADPRRQRPRIQLTNHEAAAPAVDNQQMAERIARSLKGAGLSGYQMEIRFENGMATLNGSVSSPRQAAMAGQIAGQVPGVNRVNNQLRVSVPQPQVQPAAMYQAQAAPVPAPQGYAQPGPGARHTVYNNANLPEYAWPTYASYPNYAQVTYPKQYSASAWPYIGPFYPYPQVPLGWRKATLEWDDGYWSLNFRSRTDRWWWFFNPQNW